MKLICTAILTTLLSLFSYCQISKKNNLARVTCHFVDKNISQKGFTLYLFKFEPDNSKHFQLVKSMAVSNATITFPLIVGEPYSYLIRIKQKDSVISDSGGFLITPEQVTLNYPEDLWLRYKDMISKQNKFFSNNLLLYLEKPNKLIETSGYSKSEIKKNYEISIPGNLLLEFAVQEYERNVISQITTNIDYYHSIDKFDQIKDGISLKTLDSCITILSKKWAHTSVFKKIKAYAEQEKVLRLGKMLPAFNAFTTSNNPISSPTIFSSKKYYLLDFWACWCGPCRVDMGVMKALLSELDNAKFEIISISIDEDRQKWLKAIQTDSIPWQHFIAGPGGWHSAVAKTFNLLYIPKNIMLDENLKIVAFDVKDEKLRVFLTEHHLLKE